MKISIYNTQKDLEISRPAIKQTVQRALDFHQISCDEIALHFISDSKMRKMHEEFFSDPSPTDCISFPYAKEADYYFLGEVFVCPKTALNYVEKKGGDVYEEVTLYLVHGILHLLGFDDMNSKDKRIMRREEKKLMAHLR